MMFVGGTGLVWFGLAIGAALWRAWRAPLLLVPDLVPYAMSRIEMLAEPVAWTPRATATRSVQSMYAIGSGGLTGLGIGNSKQKHLYVPEPQNDFIFSVICEELGFIGALLVIFLFVALLLRGIYVAWHAKDKFGSMLVVGVIVQVTLQAVLNIAVVTNTIPNTGISLPFFSYGGTVPADAAGRDGRCAFGLPPGRRGEGIACARQGRASGLFSFLSGGRPPVKSFPARPGAWNRAVLRESRRYLCVY